MGVERMGAVSRVLRPVAIEEAMPSGQAGFSVMRTGRDARAGRIFSAWAPSTITTGEAPASRAAVAVRAMRVRPSWRRSCLGWPRRVEAPAARMMAAKLFMVDGAVALAEGAGVAGGAGGLDLGEDGEGDLFGSAAAEVEADGGMEAGAHFGCDGEAFGGEVGEDFFGAFAGAEEAEVGEGAGEELAEDREVVEVAVGHGDDVGACVERECGEGGLGRGEVEDVGRGEAGGVEEIGAGIDDGDAPAEFGGEAGEGLGVVAGAEDREGRRRREEFVEVAFGEMRGHLRAGLFFEDCGEGAFEGERVVVAGGAPRLSAGGPAGDGADGDTIGGIPAFDEEGGVFAAVPGGEDKGEPVGEAGDGFEPDGDGAFAAAAGAPDDVGVGGGVVMSEAGAAGGEDVAGLFHEVGFEAAAADGAETGAVGAPEHAGADGAEGGTGYADEGAEDGGGWVGAEGGGDAQEFFHAGAEAGVRCGGRRWRGEGAEGKKEND